MVRWQTLLGLTGSEVLLDAIFFILTRLRPTEGSCSQNINCPTGNKSETDRLYMSFCPVISSDPPSDSSVLTFPVTGIRFVERSVPLKKVLMSTDLKV